jgi:hypothetical protein
MYANPDTDPDYQQDPIIEHDATGDQLVGQTNGRDHRESNNQKTVDGK